MFQPHRSNLGAVIAVAVLAMAAGGCQKQTPAEANAGNAPTSNVERVVVDKPKRKTLTHTTVQPGRIEAFEQAPLAAKVSGYVDEVKVDIGDIVAADQTLVVISVPELKDEERRKEAQVAQSQAELKQADAAIAGAKAAVTSAEAQVARAEAGVARTDAEYQRWQAEHRRIAELAEARTVTQKLADEAQNQLRAADSARRESAAAVQSAEAVLEEAKVNVQKAESDKVATAAKLKVAEAELAYVRTMSRYTEIKAPFKGVVTRRNIDKGHLVTVGATATPLLVVCQTETVRVFVDVPELEAEFVDAGEKADEVEIAVQALGNRKFPAVVTRMAWSLDPSNRSLRTEVDVKNPDGVLRPGMFATATITLAERPDVLCLPTTAIVREGPDAFCCAVVDGKIVRRPVKLGLRAGAEIEVTEGLQPADEVVVSPVAALKVGQVVVAAKPENK